MYPRETGGILVGKIEGKTVIIQKAIGPGPKAIHGRNNFIRDGDYSQERLNKYVKRTIGEFDYIGEWHSHPLDNGPSAKDLNSMIYILHDRKYAIKQPILGLSILESAGIWKISFFGCIRRPYHRFEDLIPRKDEDSNL